ncbi:FtsH protease modulator YccA [Pantoea sp. Mhis]|uniref:FtsH protease modulator YccA n=1 Tax=Pantoea sp. Mhis TaxID=2576759 RepID=UPI00135C51A3|nr:FtsH protease modulator YccA [Pantoea sp. Mhis]MXP56146.1 FtsH protease modulator YccA [Pantoea sp. Mhis]
MDKIISSSHQQSLISTHKVLRNTYFLLGLTLAFSTLTATFSTFYHLPPPGLIVMLVGFYGLMFLTNSLANKPSGILAAFAFTGFLGYCLGPILTSLLSADMGSVIAITLGATTLIFFCCSTYVLTTRRDMSFLSGVMMAGFIVILSAIIANFFLHLPALQLTISVLFTLFSTTAILWETSNIIHGGETNYIRATISLYVSLYNIFVSLLGLGIANKD